MHVATLVPSLFNVDRQAPWVPVVDYRWLPTLVVSQVGVPPTVSQVATLNNVGRATLLICAGTVTVRRQAGLFMIRSTLRPVKARRNDPSCVLLLPSGTVTPVSPEEETFFLLISRLSSPSLAAYLPVVSGRVMATRSVGASGARSFVLACAMNARDRVRGALPVEQSSSIGPGF